MHLWGGIFKLFNLILYAVEFLAFDAHRVSAYMNTVKHVCKNMRVHAYKSLSLPLKLLKKNCVEKLIFIFSSVIHFSPHQNVYF